MEVTICGMPVVLPERAGRGGISFTAPALRGHDCPQRRYHGSGWRHVRREHRPLCDASRCLSFRRRRDRGAAVPRSRKGHLMPASPGLAITIHDCGRRSVLRLRGELDVCTRDQLRFAISSALEHPRCLFVVDLSALSFMDCSGLSVLVWAHQRLAAQGCQLLITGAQPIVARLIQLTGLDTELHLSTPEPVAQRPGTGRRAPFGYIRRHLERNRSAQQELKRAAPVTGGPGIRRARCRAGRTAGTARRR